MTTMNERTLGFLGAGNMAGALIKGLLHAKVSAPSQILASDAKSERLELLAKTHGIRTTLDNHALVRESDVIVLAVKPGHREHTLAAIIDFDDLGILTRLDPMTDEPRRD